MSASVETHEFQAEVKQVLDLMVHSLYTHKDVFLRELISNSSDALDKLRFEALTNKDLLPADALHIRLEPNAAARTLAIHDNGIGMTREDVIRHIGTIAKSGTKEFLQALRGKHSGATPELIGQFGVGFYASFMVADRVTLITRRAGETQGTRWESSGADYTLADAERDSPGTTVILHLKAVDAEDGIDDYTEEWTLKRIVKKYSDFVAYPIRMMVKRTTIERDEQGQPKPGASEATTLEDEVLNSMQAIWLRPKEEVTEDEYHEFYKHISHDWTDPLKHLSIKMEGTFEARALLYIPAKAPFDLYARDTARRGLQLYVKRVFIMDGCKDLLPDYLRFIKGVIDAEDLSLNISRETLQHDRQIKAIRAHLVKRVLEELTELQRNDSDTYRGFFAEFGAVLKEGLLGWEERQEALLDLLLCASTHHPTDPTTLAEYVGRMRDGQEAIYYMTGPSRAAVEHSPHLEAFRDKGYEVLLLTDRVDEVWQQRPMEFRGKKFQSIGKGAVALGSEEERKDAETRREQQEAQFKDLMTCLRAAIQDDVKEVRLSTRLTTSPACLVGEESDLTPQLEELLRQSGQQVPKIKRVLELNPNHPLLPKLQALFEKDKRDPLLQEYAELLYGQALLAEGGHLPDPAAFSKRVADLMVRAV